MIRVCPQFPNTFSSLYASGEVSGKLDDSLRQLHRLYNEEGSRKLHLVSKWVPWFIYMGVALMVAYIAVRGMQAYMNELNSMSHF
jgi:type II secretory pathway component PulF